MCRTNFFVSMYSFTETRGSILLSDITVSDLSRVLQSLSLLLGITKFIVNCDLFERAFVFETESLFLKGFDFSKLYKSVRK